MIADIGLLGAHGPPAAGAPHGTRTLGWALRHVPSADHAAHATVAVPADLRVPADSPGHAATATGNPEPAGWLEVRLAIPNGQASPSPDEARRVVSRVRAWGAEIDPHVPGSQVACLNDDVRTSVRLRPTLAAALEWATEAAWLTGGALDVTNDPQAGGAVRAADRPGAVGVFTRPPGSSAALAGWSPGSAVGPADDHGDGRWRLTPRWQLAGPAQRLPGEPPSRRTVLFRRPGVVFDLDAVRRGWLADRALALLSEAPGALIEVDGAFAIRVAAGDRCEIPIADPFGLLDPLTVFRLEGPRPGIPAKFGLATARGDGTASGVAQASVLAATAREADALARCALLLDPADGLGLLDRAGAFGAVLVTVRGRALTLPQTGLWLAA